MSRLLIVANRLPITVRPTESGVEVERSTGGLATGLLRPHEQADGLWIGWSGAAPESLTPVQQDALDRRAGGPAPGRRSPLQRSGHPLLRRVLQRGPLAPVSLSARPGPAPGQRLGELRRSQPALRRRGRRPVPAGRPGLGARLPAPAPSRPPSSPPSRSQNRILPPHPVSRPRSCSEPCRPGPSCWRGSSAPTWSAFTRRPTCATSPPR